MHVNLSQVQSLEVSLPSAQRCSVCGILITLNKLLSVCEHQRWARRCVSTRHSTLQGLLHSYRRALRESLKVFLKELSKSRFSASSLLVCWQVSLAALSVVTKSHAVWLQLAVVWLLDSSVSRFVHFTSIIYPWVRHYVFPIWRQGEQHLAFCKDAPLKL